MLGVLFSKSVENLRCALPPRQAIAAISRYQSFATATFDLKHFQPSESPIDTSHITAKALDGVPIQSFRIFTNFLSDTEQLKLLKGSLKRLDEIRGVSRTAKQRRRALARQTGDHASLTTGSEPRMLPDCFLPEDCYEFSEAHFDDVIHDYRESHVSNWPDDLQQILSKVLTLIPPGNLDLSSVQSHVLHLAPSGVILPHIDNLEASGGTILGVSLGATRIMRLQHKDNVDGTEWVDVLLESGSVYVQTENVRYDFKHSIQTSGIFRGKMLVPGHRLSIMMRDLYESRL
ncbi:hypothetical protein FRB94_001043 [Tulasnella sp. JGI-2019a]|nr:hypothetical protein FRB94_001043 [Tulasnella sp. JGI-2019a]